MLGLLNPFLYQNPTAFNDITQGNNPGCGTSGFEAAKGWDPVTGLGTPKFGQLLEAAMKTDFLKSSYLPLILDSSSE